MSDTGVEGSVRLSCHGDGCRTPASDGAERRVSRTSSRRRTWAALMDASTSDTGVSCARGDCVDKPDRKRMENVAKYENLDMGESKSIARLPQITLDNLSGVKERSCIPSICGNMPMVTPRVIPLELIFFRRIFSILHKRFGNDGEIPVDVFESSVTKLFHMLGMDKEARAFDISDYDTDQSGTVSWNEFVMCWRRSQVQVVLSWAERIFMAMEDPSTCVVGRIVSGIITALIFLSSTLYVLSTMPELREAPPDCPHCEPIEHSSFQIMETLAVVLFTWEYLIRASTAPFSRNELLDYEQVLESVTERQHMVLTPPWVRLAQFVVQPMNVIDLIVVLPFYIEEFVGEQAGSSTVLRVLRLTRLARLVKLGRYFEVLQLIVRVFKRSTRALWVLLFYFTLGICFSAAAMFFMERGTWDEQERAYLRVSEDGTRSISPFRSIPHTFWWSIVTCTTVGYGDLVPYTAPGKVVASATMLCGLLVLAMPISVISMNFDIVWNDWLEEKRVEREASRTDALCVARALEGLRARARMIVELFDGDEFLGECEWADLPIDRTEVVAVGEDMKPLRPNPSKGLPSRAQGLVSVGYRWQPQEALTAPEDGPAKAGLFEVRVRRAEGLLPRLDGRARNVHAVVRCWPRSQICWQEDEVTEAEARRTITAPPGLDPVWEEKVLITYSALENVTSERATNSWAKQRSREAPSEPTSVCLSKPEPCILRRGSWGSDSSPEIGGQCESRHQPAPSSRSVQDPPDPPNMALQGAVEAQAAQLKEQGQEIRALTAQIAELRELLLITQPGCAQGVMQERNRTPELVGGWLAEELGSSPELAGHLAPEVPLLPGCLGDGPQRS